MDTITLTIDGKDVDYVPASALDGVVPVPTERRIVVAQRGWALVGLWSEDGDEITLTNASVIRIWGTTAGLGELAANGPTTKTKLDPAGTVRFHRLSIVLSIDVTGGTW